MNSKRSLLMILLPAIMLSSMSHADQPLQLVNTVDLERYQGRWYEIARLPNRFQRQCADSVSADYALREDGRIDVVNRCRQDDGQWRESRGIARPARGEDREAALEVRFAPAWLSFLPMVWGEYRIIALGDDYDFSVVGTENRRYLWFLARNPEVSEQIRQTMVEAARAQGFAVDELSWTQHEPNDG
jgi:apolipoprotein D and lipocalin family protein